MKEVRYKKLLISNEFIEEVLLRTTMIPTYQTIFKPPHGNCWQAAVASIFNMSLDEVPNFVEYDDYNEKFEAFLEGKGLYPINLIPVDDRGETIRVIGYHLISVKSPRGDWDHVLVGKDGLPIFDPYEHGNCKHEGVNSFILFGKIID